MEAVEAPPVRPPSAEDRLALYRALRLPRAVEDKMLRLIRQNRLSKWFSGYGQEAIAVGCAWALEERDWLLPMHRNLGLWTTRGVPLRPLLAQLFARVETRWVPLNVPPAFYFVCGGSDGSEK